MSYIYEGEFIPLIGDKIAIFNQTMGGKFIVETYEGEVVEPGEYVINGHKNYLIEFPDGDRCERFVDPDPEAHKDPDAYVLKLNKQRFGED